MARPAKTNLDYFPLLCNPEEGLWFVLVKYGFKGYGLVIRLWTRIYATGGYFCYWNEKQQFIFCKEGKITSDFCDEVLQTCFEENVFSLVLYQRHGILTSAEIQQVYFKVIKDCKRKGIQVNPSFDLSGFVPGLFSNDSGNIPEETMVSSGRNPELTPVSSGTIQEETPQRKEEEKRENESKKEGKEKSDTPNLSNDFSDSLNENEREKEEEKSSAKKEEEILLAAMAESKSAFLQNAQGYYWEVKDDEALYQLLVKIKSGEGKMGIIELVQKFRSFIYRLPKYWKARRFTVPLLNQHYNEIVTEANAKNPKPKVTLPKPIAMVPEPEPTQKEKEDIRKSFLNTIQEKYNQFKETSELSFASYSLVYDTLVQEKLIKPTAEEIESWRKKAIARHKQLLEHPTGRNERNLFRKILENYEQAISTSEKQPLERLIKEEGVRDYFQKWVDDGLTFSVLLNEKNLAKC